LRLHRPLRIPIVPRLYPRCIHRVLLEQRVECAPRLAPRVHSRRPRSLCIQYVSSVYPGCTRRAPRLRPRRAKCLPMHFLGLYTAGLTVRQGTKRSACRDSTQSLPYVYPACIHVVSDAYPAYAQGLSSVYPVCVQGALDIASEPCAPRARPLRARFQFAPMVRPTGQGGGGRITQNRAPDRFGRRRIDVAGDTSRVFQSVDCRGSRQFALQARLSRQLAPACVGGGL
jgi:hypothetical protein